MKISRENTCIVFLTLSLLAVVKGQGTVCPNNTIIGPNPPSKKNDVSTPGQNAVLLIEPNSFLIDCCGYIDQWELWALNGITTPVDIIGQIWEPGNPYTKKGEHTLTVNSAGSINVISVTSQPQVMIMPGYVMGFYEPTTAVVAGGGAGTDANKKAAFTGGESTFAWGGVTAEKDEFSINIRVQPSGLPRFVNLDAFEQMDSTIAGGTVLKTLTVTDDDPADIPNLTIVHIGSTGSASSMFVYDGINKQIKVQYGVTMVPGFHDMTFTVSDGCSSTEGTLTLKVLNKPPVLTSLAIVNETTISEDLTVETLLHELIVTDVQPVTCVLNSTGVPFQIMQIPGKSNYGIYLKNGAALDYFVKYSYVLDLSCNDGYDTTNGKFTVYLILNELPTINNLPIGIDTTEQTTTETTLYTFSVTDHENEAVSCTYNNVPATTVVFLKPSTNFNEIDVVLQSNPGLNYDTQKTYRMDIECSDGRRSDTNVFFMNVLRNKPPTFTNIQNFTTISGPTSRIGQLVFDVESTDPENDQVEYSVSCRFASDCPFQIFDSGEIVLTRSIKGETVPAYDLYVYVNDGHTTTGPRSITVHIADINYVPVITNLPLPSPLVIPENSALGKSVFQVSIQDNDETDIHTYKMTSVPSDGMIFFEINPITGLVTTSTTNNINYESDSPTTFVLSITVTDSKDTATKDLSLTISNEKEPVKFTKKNYVLSLNEGSAGTVLANPGYLYTEQDIGDTHKFGMDCGAGVGYFSINSDDGIISLITAIDVDATGSASSYTCSVTISDGTFQDTATVTINVNNINDNTPVFSPRLYTYYLDINTATNSPFGKVLASDGDAGKFGILTYTINQSHLGVETFGVQQNGDLYLKSPLTSYGYGQSLKFEVYATDSGGLQSSAMVFVLIPELATITTVDSEEYVSFFEYPANPAWLIVAVVLGLICCILPVYMIRKYGESCSYKGRVGDDLDDETDRKSPDSGEFDPDWKPWRWFERKVESPETFGTDLYGNETTEFS